MWQWLQTDPRRVEADGRGHVLEGVVRLQTDPWRVEAATRGRSVMRPRRYRRALVGLKCTAVRGGRRGSWLLQTDP